MTLRELIKKAKEEGISLDAPLVVSHEEYSDPEDSCGVTVWREISALKLLKCGAVNLGADGFDVTRYLEEPDLKDLSP
jgi:hypothetical protein